MSYIILRPNDSNAIILTGVIISDYKKAYVPLREWEEFVAAVNAVDIKKERQARVNELEREKSQIGDYNGI